MAEILELHMKALDPKDESAQKERDAYLKLAHDHREIATRLHAVAGQMAGYRDLPMGRHDPKAMSAPSVREGFKKFVTLEQELLALLQQRLEPDRRMLIEMGGGGGAAG